MKIIYNLVLNILTIIFLYHAIPANSYICSTPAEWLGKIEHAGFYLSIGVGGKWPGGVVKYHLNDSLTENDKQLVEQAIEEFHRKTCIRFEPKSSSDPNYVSIELDNSICGTAHVCMQGGYQFAKFGQNCRKKNNMIHQLGHTLCLSHEDHRHQGDKFITSGGSCNSTKNETENIFTSRIYDQASQMHFGCDSENECGYQITSGLSVLDADYINALYDCQGCYRHRWIPEQSMSSINQSYFFSFGYADLDGQTMYPCRAFFGGEVSIGKYNPAMKTCYIGFERQEYKVCENFEVLSVPGGLRTNESDYMLSDGYEGMPAEKESALFEKAVVAGRLPWADGTSPVGHGYVAFGSVPNLQTSCNFDKTWWYGGANRKLDVIGRAWRYKTGVKVYASVCNREFSLRAFYVLTCKAKGAKISQFDTRFMLPHYPFGNDDWYRETSSTTTTTTTTERPGVSVVSSTNKSADVFKSEKQRAEQQSNYFLPGFITGFLVLGVLMAAVCGILYYGKVTKRFGFERGMPIFYTRDRLYEE